MKIVAFSDTHSYHREVIVPDGDVLICAGDITRKGEIETVLDFAEWMGALPHRFKLFTPGNHDFCLDISQTQFDGRARRVLEENGIHVLLDASRTFDGVKFYGSPWVPHLAQWAFYDRNRDYFESAPKDIDVLITHAPPIGIRDGTMIRHKSDPADLVPDTRGELHIGSKFIRRYIERCPRLALHVFGHVHEAYGSSGSGVVFVNACACNRAYEPVNAPIVTDLFVPERG